MIIYHGCKIKKFQFNGKPLKSLSFYWFKCYACLRKISKRWKNQSKWYGFYLEGYIFLFHNCLLYFDIVIENKILEVEFRFEDIKELPLLITLKKKYAACKTFNE